MLRECCRYEELTKLIINSEQFYKFFEYVEFSTFDIASDAFLTFRVVLMIVFQSHSFPSAIVFDNSQKIYRNWSQENWQPKTCVCLKGPNNKFKREKKNK